MSDQPPLTAKQRSIFEYIVRYSERNGYSPSVREIADEFSIQSTNGVADHIRALTRKGYLARDGRRARALRVAQGSPNAKEAEELALGADGRIADAERRAALAERRLLDAEERVRVSVLLEAANVVRDTQIDTADGTPAGVKIQEAQIWIRREIERRIIKLAKV